MGRTATTIGILLGAMLLAATPPAAGRAERGLRGTPRRHGPDPASVHLMAGGPPPL